MKSAPRLRLEPRPSRIGPLLAAGFAVATAVLMFFSVADPASCATVVAVVGVIGLRAVRRMSRPPLLLYIGVDRRVSVTMPDGRTHDGKVHGDTSVGEWLTTIVWVPDGALWFVAAKTLVVLPDMLPPDDFRRLRTYLRHGRETPDPDTSGVAAG
jgi:hypothetical protein